MTRLPGSPLAWSRIGILAFVSLLWLLSPPEGVTPQAWHLFAIFLGAISAVILGAATILPASILALVAVVLTGTLDARTAYAGFGSGFILLIVVAFLIGRGVVRSGLGNRIAYWLVRAFGRSTLGLGYSLVAADALIAPAFPSNTARSGVLYPIVLSLAVGGGSRVEDGTRRRLGAFLMMNSMAGLGISSALWFTAMAANPVGAAIAGEMGVEISFASWLAAASLPSVVALAVVPAVLYRAFPPELTATPQAPAEAERRLAEMGPLSRDEKITAATCVGLVLGWAAASPLGLDATIVAFLGLAVLMLTGVFTKEDLERSGDALGTLIWFSVLYTLSSSLNTLGFMSYLGQQLAGVVAGLSWPVVYLVLIVGYVLLHYLFVSQTAQLLALFGVFVGVGVDAGVPGGLISMMLLFASSFFSAITPQGSSANVLFAGSGYLTQGELYRHGALVTALNLLVFLIVGTPWLLIVGS